VIGEHREQLEWMDPEVQLVLLALEAQRVMSVLRVVLEQPGHEDQREPLVTRAHRVSLAFLVRLVCVESLVSQEILGHKVLKASLAERAQLEELEQAEVAGQLVQQVTRVLGVTTASLVDRANKVALEFKVRLVELALLVSGVVSAQSVHRVFKDVPVQMDSQASRVSRVSIGQFMLLLSYHSRQEIVIVVSSLVSASHETVETVSWSSAWSMIIVSNMEGQHGSVYVL